ncbi:hypothetical protein [Bradyrhizobium sp.]|nr:hypothetical protein [Bradyrhizobium sp.]
MRKPVTASTATASPRQPAGSRDQRSVELVCVTLGLAMLAIVLRIASIW